MHIVTSVRGGAANAAQPERYHLRCVTPEPQTCGGISITLRAASMNEDLQRSRWTRCFRLTGTFNNEYIYDMYCMSHGQYTIGHLRVNAEALPGVFSNRNRSHLSSVPTRLPAHLIRASDTALIIKSGGTDFSAPPKIAETDC